MLARFLSPWIVSLTSIFVPISRTQTTVLSGLGEIYGEEESHKPIF